MDNMAISQNLYDWICEHLPAESVILELGAGEGTQALLEHYYVISVESNPTYLKMNPKVSIYAPLTGEEQKWYDVAELHDWLPMFQYDMLLVDGPPGWLSTRSQLLEHRALFDLTGWVIVDDVHREDERYLFNELKQDRHSTVLKTAEEDWSGIIWPEGE